MRHDVGMKGRHELDELRARQRRQRSTIEAALPTATPAKAVQGGFDTAEIHIRLIAAERLKGLEEDLDKVEERQAREAVHRTAGHRVEHERDHWAGKAADRLTHEMFEHDFNGKIPTDDIRIHALRESLLLLQAADAIADETRD